MINLQKYLVEVLLPTPRHAGTPPPIPGARMSPLEFGELIDSPVEGRRTVQEPAGVWQSVDGGDGQCVLLLPVKGLVAGLGHEAGAEVQ